MGSQTCRLHASGFLHSAGWQLDTNTFGWPIGPNFKCQVVQQFKSATIERYTMHKLHTNGKHLLGGSMYTETRQADF